MGMEVVFYPKPTEENPTPGPFSVGTTDNEGKFTLVTRNGDPGAVIGINQVGFELPGASQSALDAAKNNLQELMGDPAANKEGIMLVRDRIATIEETRKQFSMVAPKFLKSRTLEITVPPEGLVDSEIDVSRK